MIGYIYLITNTITNKQYVGQTIQTIKTRYKGHIRSAQYNTDKCYLHKAMNKYGYDNFEVEEITHIDYKSKDLLFQKLNELEIFYIAKYNTLVPNGYNLTKGGTSGAELYKKEVDEYDLNGNFIQTHESIISACLYVGTECNRAILKCCKGESKFAFQKIWRYHNEPLEKYCLPDVNIAKRVYKKAPIDKYSLNGTLLKSYNSITEAADDFNKTINKSHITDCCNGKLHTAYGYIWRYKGDPFEKYNSKDDKRFSKCQKLSLSGEVLGVYSSIKEACESSNLDHKKCNPHIVQCCKGKRNTAYGYKWKYVNA